MVLNYYRHARLTTLTPFNSTPLHSSTTVEYNSGIAVPANSAMWGIHGLRGGEEMERETRRLNPLMHDFYFQGKTRLVVLLRTSGD